MCVTNMLVILFLSSPVSKSSITQISMVSLCLCPQRSGSVKLCLLPSRNAQEESSVGPLLDQHPLARTCLINWNVSGSDSQYMCYLLSAIVSVLISTI